MTKRMVQDNRESRGRMSSNSLSMRSWDSRRRAVAVAVAWMTMRLPALSDPNLPKGFLPYLLDHPPLSFLIGPKAMPHCPFYCCLLN